MLVREFIYKIYSLLQGKVTEVLVNATENVFFQKKTFLFTMTEDFVWNIHGANTLVKSASGRFPK